MRGQGLPAARLTLVYCSIYAQLPVLRALGGASYLTGIILVVVRMAVPLAAR